MPRKYGTGSLSFFNTGILAWPRALFGAKTSADVSIRLATVFRNIRWNYTRLALR